jgi:hypothetical protein
MLGPGVEPYPWAPVTSMGARARGFLYDGSLGNAYAKAQGWNEAQAVDFEA